MTARADEHAALVQLLPFYVNGTLGTKDRAAIARALTTDPALARELRQTETLAAMIRQGGTAMTQDPNNSADRLERLHERIDDDADVPAAHDPGAPAPPAPLSSLLGYLSPSRWHPAITLALALAAVGQTAWIASHSQQAGYQTASGGDDLGGAHGPLIVIRLRADARWDAVSALLAAQGLTIIAGPDDDRLTLRLEPADGDAEAVRSRLAQSPQVAFAAVLK